MDLSSLKRTAPVVYKPCVTSTNTIIKGLVPSGIAEGFTLVAEKQTAGRGRMGRSFESPEGGLYLSMLFFPKCAPEDISTLTPCAAVAVRRAIEKVCGISVDIKWPNDLLIDGKKLCGILTESSVYLGRRFVVVGIGINVNTDFSVFPEELQKIAVSLCEKTGETVGIERLAAAIIGELDTMYSLWTENRKYCLDEYRSACVTVGCDIVIICGEERKNARSLGIGEDFSLIAEVDGQIRNVSFGEVSIRKI
ncbi:MAG: biotin--[acetyl-CoA-carboxylase] ligase [Eubacteriales bacterium]|nr:biotin--[acetyl-CoA-carboxylase] ligase [Eubacteriales bacterium]